MRPLILLTTALLLLAPTSQAQLLKLDLPVPDLVRPDTTPPPPVPASGP